MSHFLGLRAGGVQSCADEGGGRVGAGGGGGGGVGGLVGFVRVVYEFYVFLVPRTTRIHESFVNQLTYRCKPVKKSLFYK